MLSFDALLIAWRQAQRLSVYTLPNRQVTFALSAFG